MYEIVQLSGNASLYHSLNLQEPAKDALLKKAFETEITALRDHRADKQHAADCLRLAGEANDAYVRIALTELAREFSAAAETAECDTAAAGKPPRRR